MAVTNYYTVNGAIIGESTGGVRTDYMVDALGSVTGTANQSAQVLNTYRYKPYGALLAKTGTGADPKMQWVGSLGYRQTARRQSDVYVRARHYGSLPGRWATVDPLWAGAQGYAYANGSAVTFSDPTGQLVEVRGEYIEEPGVTDLNGNPIGGYVPCDQGFASAVKGFCRRVLNGELEKNIRRINDCIRAAVSAGGPQGPTHCPTLSGSRLTCLRRFCATGVVTCKRTNSAGNTDLPYGCPGNFDSDVPQYTELDVDPDAVSTSFDPETEQGLGVFVHELLHACGVDHVMGKDRSISEEEAAAGKRGVPDSNACNNIIACCIKSTLDGPKWIKDHGRYYDWCAYHLAINSRNNSLRGVPQYSGPGAPPNPRAIWR